MGVRLGLNAKLFHGEKGSLASNLIDNARDVTLNLEKGEADVSTRGAGGWRQTVATLKEGAVEWTMVWDTDDAAFTAIKNAFFNDDAIALAVLDKENGSGLDADFVITNFTRNEPLEEALTVNVTAKPTRTDRAPQWKEANGGGE